VWGLNIRKDEGRIGSGPSWQAWGGRGGDTIQYAMFILQEKSTNISALQPGFCRFFRQNGNKRQKKE
jgi:hypothetical protein